jgi:hypothetical protein
MAVKVNSIKQFLFRRRSNGHIQMSVRTVKVTIMNPIQFFNNLGQYGIPVDNSQNRARWENDPTKVLSMTKCLKIVWILQTYCARPSKIRVRRTLEIQLVISLYLSIEKYVIHVHKHMIVMAHTHAYTIIVPKRTTEIIHVGTVQK